MDHGVGATVGVMNLRGKVMGGREVMVGKVEEREMEGDLIGACTACSAIAEEIAAVRPRSDSASG